MITCDPLPAPPPQTERQTELKKILPAPPLAGGKNKKVDFNCTCRKKTVISKLLKSLEFYTEV